MSNEISGTFSMTVINGDYRDTIVQTFQIDQSNIGMSCGVVTVQDNPTETTIDLSELTGEGVIFMKNLSTTDTVTWGPDSGGSMVPVGEMKPGEWSFWRHNGSATLKMYASTDPSLVEIRCYED